MSKKIIVGVLGLPVNKNKQVLLTQRHAPGRKDWHNKWQLAGGGLDYGETTEDCLVREMYEELTVKPKILYPHPIVKTRIWYADEKQKKMDAHIILVTYIVDIGDQEPNLSNDPDWETSNWSWYSLEGTRKLDSLPMTFDIVEEAFEVINKNGILKT